jgi:DNA mismatch repair protein MSH6
MGKAKDPSNSTPARAPPSLKKQTSSVGSASNQRSIQSFFTKKAPSGTPGSSNGVSEASETSKSVNASTTSIPVVKKPAFRKSAVKNLTPVPSSDAVGPPSSQENENGGIPKEVEASDLPSPSTPAKGVLQVVNSSALVLGSSPSRKVPRLASTFLRF